MHHDELDSTVVVDRRMAGVEAGAARATGQEKQRNKKRGKFHGDSVHTENNATV
jgi:hypothetical protein